MQRFESFWTTHSSLSLSLRQTMSGLTLKMSVLEKSLSYIESIKVTRTPRNTGTCKCLLWSSLYLILIYLPVKKQWNTFTLTRVAACLGNPPLRTPTSVVVPPISITIASWTPDKKAAPRMEFVGPEANVKTGRCLVCSALDYSSNKNMFLWFVRFNHIFPYFINVKLNWLERGVRTKIYLQKK